MQCSGIVDLERQLQRAFERIAESDRRARVGVVFAALYTVAGLAFMCAMAWLLNRDFPPGLLQEFVDLPWPLG